MSDIVSLSIIIPVAPNETSSWKNLINKIESFSDGLAFEIIIASTKEMEIDGNYRVSMSEVGRAKQMNQAAKVSNGEYLWFVHSDSDFNENVIVKLKNLIDSKTTDIYYHQLKFIENNNALRINELGVCIRSDLFKMPFGDQGLFIKKNDFCNLGGYPENCLYGEDHLFIWKARQHGYKIRSTETKMFTSARKYLDNGWGKTTLKHLYLTYKQAAPEFIKLIKIKYLRNK